MNSKTEQKDAEKVRAGYNRVESVKQILINMQAQVRGQRLSLALGDYVIYRGERINALPYSWKMPAFVDKLCIISAISSDASKYCIEGQNVFVDRASLTFFRDADPDSLTRIIMMLEGVDPDAEEEQWGEQEDDSDAEVADDSPTPEPPKKFIGDPRDHRSTQKAIVAHHEANRKK